MTPRSERHLKRLLTTIRRELERKYTRGHREHGGDLLNLSAEKLLEEAIAESYDQLVYLLTLREALRCSSCASKLRSPRANT